MENASKCSDDFSDNESDLRFEDLHPKLERKNNIGKKSEDDMDTEDFNYSMDSFMTSEFLSSNNLSLSKNGSTLSKILRESRSFSGSKGMMKSTSRSSSHFKNSLNVPNVNKVPRISKAKKQ